MEGKENAMHVSMLLYSNNNINKCMKEPANAGYANHWEQKKNGNERKIQRNLFR